MFSNEKVIEKQSSESSASFMPVHTSLVDREDYFGDIIFIVFIRMLYTCISTDISPTLAIEKTNCGLLCKFFADEYLIRWI